MTPADGHRAASRQKGETMRTLEKPKDRHRWIMAGLPGTSQDVPSVPAVSVADALRCVREGFAVSFAEDYGSVNVWRDDVGQLRCCFQRFRVTVNEEVTVTLKRTREWLTEWWPKMSRPDTR